MKWQVNFSYKKSFSYSKNDLKKAMLSQDWWIALIQVRNSFTPAQLILTNQAWSIPLAGIVSTMTLSPFTLLQVNLKYHSNLELVDLQDVRSHNQ